MLPRVTVNLHVWQRHGHAFGCCRWASILRQYRPPNAPRVCKGLWRPVRSGRNRRPDPVQRCGLTDHTRFRSRQGCPNKVALVNEGRPLTRTGAPVDLQSMRRARIGSSTIRLEPDGEDTMATIREQSTRRPWRGPRGWTRRGRHSEASPRGLGRALGDNVTRQIRQDGAGDDVG
jgi:hypothetical protein